MLRDFSSGFTTKLQNVLSCDVYHVGASPGCPTNTSSSNTVQSTTVAESNREWHPLKWHFCQQRNLNQVTALIIFVSLDVDKKNTQKQWRNMERGRSTYTENLQYAKTSFEPQLLMLSLGQLEDTLKLLFLS